MRKTQKNTINKTDYYVTVSIETGTLTDGKKYVLVIGTLNIELYYLHCMYSM
jgi:hypothetical protein